MKAHDTRDKETDPKVFVGGAAYDGQQVLLFSTKTASFYLLRKRSRREISAWGQIPSGRYDAVDRF